MAQTAFQSSPVQLSRDLPQVGSKAPGFTLIDGDLGEVTNETFAGREVVYNIFPSVDTGVCAASVRHFNEDTAGLSSTVVASVSRDLPFALGRFCATGSLDNVEVASDLRYGFGRAFSVAQQDDPLVDLFTRAVVIADEEGKVIHNQLVDEIITESGYDSALATLK